MPRDVLVVVGAGGMGLAIARRIGPGRLLLLADVNEAALQAAGGAWQAREEADGRGARDPDARGCARQRTGRQAAVRLAG